MLAIARFNRALANRLSGDYEMAIVEFTQFIGGHPTVAEAYFHRGLAYRARREFPAALADFRTALTLKPDYEEAKQLHRETQHEAVASAVSIPAAGNARHSPHATMKGGRPAPIATAPSPRTFSPPGPARHHPVATPPPDPSACRPQPVPSKTQPGRQAPTEPAPGRRRRALWVSSAVLGIGVTTLAVSLLIGSTSDAASDADLRLSTQQLCDKFQNAPAEAAFLNGKEIEVSGVIQSVSNSDGASSVPHSDRRQKNVVQRTLRCRSGGQRRNVPERSEGEVCHREGALRRVQEGATVRVSSARVVLRTNRVALRKKTM